MNEENQNQSQNQDIKQENLFETLNKVGCIIPQGASLSLPFMFEPPIKLLAGVGANCRIGAFSYTVAKMQLFQCGRYCSIGHGVEVLSDHPTNALSTHVFPYMDIYENFYTSKDVDPPPLPHPHPPTHLQTPNPPPPPPPL